MNVFKVTLGIVFATVAALALPLPASAGEAAPIEWISTRVATSPALDGRVDAVWSSAVPLKVMVREAIGGTGVAPISRTVLSL